MGGNSKQMIILFLPYGYKTLNLPLIWNECMLNLSTKESREKQLVILCLYHKHYNFKYNKINNKQTDSSLIIKHKKYNVSQCPSEKYQGRHGGTNANTFHTELVVCSWMRRMVGRKQGLCCPLCLSQEVSLSHTPCSP